MCRFFPALVLIACMAVLISGSRYPNPRNGNSNSYPRPSRGFKNTQMSTARGFGKRDSSPAMGDSYTMSDPRRTYQSSILKEEMQSNPDLAGFIVDKLLDLDGDGEITPEEMYYRRAMF